MSTEKGPANKGSEEAKAHWEAVKEHCKYAGSLEPECIDAWYAALGEENKLELLISLEQWWWNQPIIAFFGTPIAVWAVICAFYFLIYPDRAPSIQDAPWEDVPFFFRGIMIWLVTGTANLVKPDLFFTTQLLTGGQSDLIDLELIYMTGYEPVLYFLIESMMLPFMQLFSMIWVTFFWWVYGAEVFWFIVKIFFWSAFGRQDDDLGWDKEDNYDDKTDNTADTS